MLVTKQLILDVTSVVFFHTMEVNGYIQLFVANILQNIYLWLTEGRKLVEVWNNLG